MQFDITTQRLPKIYKRGNKDCYLDPVRKKLIYITPEETVRQKVISYLIDVLEVPVEVISVEAHLSHYGVNSKRRADIIIHGSDDDGILRPVAIVECKAPGIILGEKASVILNDYKEVLFEILPQLKLIDDFQLVLSGLAECPKSLELRFAVLLYQINEYFDEISTIFKFSNAIKDKISLLIKMHGCDYNSKASIKRLIRVFEKAVFDFFDFEFAIATAINDENKLIEIKNARILATEIINNGECYSLKQLAINGHDLLELGYKGRQIQQRLNFLLDGVVKERVVNNKNSLIKYLMDNNG